MKKSDKVMLQSLGIGVLAALGLYWLNSDNPWWVYPIVIFVIGAGAYSQGIKDAAAEKILEKDDD